MLTLAAWVLAQSAQSPELIEYPRLARGLSDLRWMAEAPRPGESSRLLSWPDESGARAAEFAGPGAVTRVWVSRPAGELRFFLDGAEEPTQTWDLAGVAAGGGPDWMTAPLAGRCGDGWQCHVPVTFARSLRVEHVVDDEAVRAQISVRRFGEGVTVPSFPARLPGHWRLALRSVAQRMASNEHPEAQYEAFLAGPVRRMPYEDVTPMERGELHYHFEGHGVVRYLQVELLNENVALPLEQLLRALTVRIEMGVPKLQDSGEVLLEAPFAEFFGSVPGGGPSATAWHAGFDQGSARFHFRFPIPYRDGMKIVFTSPLREATRLKVSHGSDLYADPEEVPALRLRGGWVHGTHADAPQGAALVAGGPARLASYVFSATGGDAQPWQWSGPLACFASLDPGSGRGYAHTTRRDGPHGFGRSSLQRVFAYDAPQHAGELRFDPGLRFSGGAPVQWAAYALWYAPADASSNFGGAGSAEDRRLPPLPEAPFAVAEGAIEGEYMQVSSVTAGTRVKVRTVDEAGAGDTGDAAWSRRQFLWWSAGGDGLQQLNLEFPVERTGEQEVRVQLASGPEFGRVQLFVDGVRAGEPVDCSAESLRPGGERVITVQRLMPRPGHRLGLRSLDGRPVGLDYLRLVPVDGEASGE